MNTKSIALLAVAMGCGLAAAIATSQLMHRREAAESPATATATETTDPAQMVDSPESILSGRK